MFASVGSFVKELVSTSTLLVSSCWNLSWLSAWTFDNLEFNLSILKLISSYLFVNCWNCFSISDYFNKCLVSTSSVSLTELFEFEFEDWENDSE